MDPYLPPVSPLQARTRARPKLPVGSMALAGLAVTLINLVWISLTCCMCGHSSFMTSVTVVPAFITLVSMQLPGRHNPVWDRALGGLFIVVQALLLVKNAADILLLGHSPLLR